MKGVIAGNEKWQKSIIHGWPFQETQEIPISWDIPLGTIDHQSSKKYAGKMLSEFHAFILGLHLH